MSVSKKKDRKGKADVQTDSEAERIVSELEDMVSPVPAKKTGAEKVAERASELKDAAEKPATVFGPSGETASPSAGRTDVSLPGSEGHKRANEEFMRKKSEAEEGGTDPVATPSGPSSQPRGAGRTNRRKFAKDAKAEKQAERPQPDEPAPTDSPPAKPPAKPRALRGGVALPDAGKATKRLGGE